LRDVSNGLFPLRVSGPWNQGRFFLAKTPKDVQSILWRIRRQKLRNRTFCPSRTTKKGDWPLSDPFFFYMSVVIRLRLIDIFILPDQCKYIFGSCGTGGERSRLGIGRKRKVVVAAIRQVFCSTLRMTPDSILQNFVPNIATTCLGKSWVTPHQACVEDLRVTKRIHSYTLPRSPQTCHTPRMQDTSPLMASLATRQFAGAESSEAKRSNS